MQLNRLSACIIAGFLVGCASPNASREMEEAAEHAGVVLEGSTEVAAEDTAEDVQAAALKVQEKEETQSFLYSLWWTWKYTMWGQGSKEDWPWAW